MSQDTQVTFLTQEAYDRLAAELQLHGASVAEVAVELVPDHR